MAKRVTKKSRGSRPRTGPKRRISTMRQQTAGRARPAARPRSKPTPALSGSTRETARKARGARAARAAASLETVAVTFGLRDVSGRLIRDPETFFTFRRLSDLRQLGDQQALALTGSAPTFDLPVATGELRVCEIDPRRFRFAQSPIFSGTPAPPIRRDLTLLREPSEWRARFTKWDDMPASFDPLKRVLRQSPSVGLFKTPETVGDLLADSAYDGLTGEAAILAKTTMLNLFFKLSRMTEPVSASRPWFSFISRIVAIGRERLLAFVDPEMDSIVRQIHDNIDHFRADYEVTPAGNHRGNVPAPWQGRIVSMVSIKSTDRLGNVQLTLTRLSGPDEVLLDSDIDENGDLLRHTLDLLKHRFNGGTHPFDIHELFVRQSGQDAAFDLGYQLV